MWEVEKKGKETPDTSLLCFAPYVQWLEEQDQDLWFSTAGSCSDDGLVGLV